MKTLEQEQLLKIKKDHGFETDKALADALGWAIGKTGFILRGDRKFDNGWSMREIEAIRKVEPGFMREVEGE